MITDTHAGLHQDSSIWLDSSLELFKHVVKTAKERKITKLVHLGDFFHNRKTTNTKTLDNSLEIADILCNLTCYFIVGNHDTHYKNKLKPHTLSLFEKHDYINVIEKSTKIDNMLLVPWNCDINIKCDYCLGHFDINGFYMNDSYKSISDLNLSSFSKFKKVFSGHFHTPSIKGNLQYIGSPIHQTFHDAGGKRGYYIFNETNGDLEFIEYTKGPRYYIMQFDDINKDLIHDNIIKIKFTQDCSTNESERIINEVESLKPLQLHIDATKMIISEEYRDENDMNDSVNTQTIIKEYIDVMEHPKWINKKVLLKMFDNIRNEVNG